MKEVHRSFVNTWQCDENEHLNVQFFVQMFDEAAAVSEAFENIATKKVKLMRRHIRFHQELHKADSTLIKCGFFEINQNICKRVMNLYRAQSGELAASAVDLLELDGQEIDNKIFDLPSEALPRGLDDEACQIIDGKELEDLIEGGHALVSNYSQLDANEVASDGRMKLAKIVSRFTDSASHVWEYAGIETGWLQDNNRGRVAVELKIEPVADVMPLTPMRLISFACDQQGKTFMVNHILQSLSDFSIIARGEVRCLTIDQETRRAGHLPMKLRLVDR